MSLVAALLIAGIITVTTGEVILSSVEDVQTMMRNEMSLMLNVNEYIDVESGRLSRMKE